MQIAIRHAVAALGVAACLSIGPAGAKSFNLTFAAPQGEHMPWISLTRTTFIAGVDKSLEGTEHKINWTTAYGGTLSKVGGTLEVIEEGIADSGMLYSLFEQAKLPLQNVAYMAPFGTDDLGLALRIFHELHEELPEMSGSWEKHGQVFVAPIGFDTFYPLTKFPIKSLKDLKGRKLAGAGAVSLWEAPIGIVPVQGNFAVHFNNLKTGVYDGLIAFTTGYYPNKLHEIARYATKVNFGAMPGGGVTVNKSVWGKLPDAVRQAMREAGVDLPQRPAREDDRAGRHLRGQDEGRGRGVLADAARPEARLGQGDAQHRQGVGGPRRSQGLRRQQGAQGLYGQAPRQQGRAGARVGQGIAHPKH